MLEAEKIDHALLPWHFTLQYVNEAEKKEDETKRFIWSLANLSRKGLQALGHHVESSQVLASLVGQHRFDNRLDGNRIWTRVPRRNSRRSLFEAKVDSLISSTSLIPTLEALETALSSQTKHQRAKRNTPLVLFVSEIKTRQINRSPESPIAKIWNECLGPRAIPFDPDARKALIAHGCNHPELRRHIKAWQKMKLTGSRWTTKE